MNFERLEERTLMAGNVAACCVKGQLIICGDACDNQICVRQCGDCKWEITGLCGTKINGRDCCIMKDVKCISIDCGCGNDCVKVTDGYLKDCLKICDTKGCNTVVCSKLCVGGLSVKTGGGRDCCFVTCCDIKYDPRCAGKAACNGVKWGACCFDTGAGCDMVLVDKLCGVCKIEVKCGTGKDLCCLSKCDVKQICVDTGKDCECDRVAVTCCKADCCDLVCEKTDRVALKDNCFEKVACKIPTCDAIDECFRELCESREWKESGCELVQELVA